MVYSFLTVEELAGTIAWLSKKEREQLLKLKGVGENSKLKIGTDSERVREMRLIDCKLLSNG